VGGEVEKKCVEGGEVEIFVGYFGEFGGILENGN